MYDQVICAFFFVQRLQLMVVFVLCCGMCDMTLFSFSSDQERPVGENFYRSRESQKKFWSEGKVKCFGHLQGWLKFIQLVNFIPFCILLVS